jgi:hypothetical protein
LKTWNKLYAASLLVLAASSVRADSTFTLTGNNTAVEGAAPTVTVNGITATLTSIIDNVPSGVLNSTTENFGVNAPPSTDESNRLDGAAGIEAVNITFTQPVLLTQLVLSSYSSGESATLTLPDSSPDIAPLIAATDIYNFASQNRVDVGESMRLTYAAGNGFSFDRFTVAPAPEVVPLPAAVWGGMTLLGGIGSWRLARGRRNAVGQVEADSLVGSPR